MIEIIWDEPFLRILKKWRKKHPELVERFQQKISLFINDPFHSSLKTHSLSGNLEGYWELSITYEYRLVFQFISDSKVLLIDIGTHDEVY
ncbi:type II toxin-antitoxin system mRNA interferase toxin, RelE/StbE family [Trichormus sp. NMC-1]|uniref:type II toxin-antitoxin system RelE/ParE family toxin n=1 Tax=Trichormus sp. NMC-1 TaxID=1853259 RepID=UPI0009F16125|nr:type II toxin-antitoxin system mRNA interferase toxin, RelE/StbE family [Trichormus sp. NMC-1]